MRTPSLAVLALLGLVRPAPGAEAPPVDFNREVRPVLSDNCFACHGPDDKARKAKLRLDTRDGLFGEADSGAGRIVQPGKPAESVLLDRLGHADPKRAMPPARAAKRPTPEQVARIRLWVEQGAKWQPHWAFVAPTRPPLPAVKDTAWARNPIDRFVLARLEKEGLRPSPEADRATLLRRASLDLTGLPPTLADLDAFLADRAPDAYEKAVDRLLASPRYGERMAMLWLDGARYADSNGFQADYERFMWRWRDWVIDAYNKNMPFDRFTVEQLAGDLLPDATLEQKIATGFNRNHRINTEGGIIAEEWRVENVADRTETTASVWLGLTVGCCRCHDHKYDPLTQKDYYRLFAFFNNVAESGVGVEQPVNHPPLVKAPRPSDTARLAELDAAIARAAEEVKAREKDLAGLQAEWEKTALRERPGVSWSALAPAEMVSAGKAKMTLQADRSVVVAGANPATDVYTVTAAVEGQPLTAFRLEALADDALPAKGPGRSNNGNFVLTKVSAQVDGQDVKIVKATADFSQEGFPVAAALAGGPNSGWAIFPKVGVTHTAIFSFERPLDLAKPAKLTVRLEFRSQYGQHQPGRIRLSVTGSKSPHEEGGLPPHLAAALELPPEQRSAAQRKELADYFRARHAGPVTEADRKLKAAQKAKQDFEATVPTVMVMAELPQPRDTFVLIRGQYDKHGDKVTAGLPAVLPPLPEGAPANRLGLAKWLVSPDHPLTARVAVNRLWEKSFGVGLVKTGENFGAQGEPPSHPELLDWLAVEFREKGWNVKALEKLIVTSAAYRQSSAVTPALHERDPENRLLARGPRFRLQAELVRDNALAVSGLLADHVGGPSVRPYMPQGVWDETNVYGNLRNYKPDAGEGLYRRSLYTIWKRTAAPPTLMLFDMPSREVCTVKRARTNTPLQALALLNEVTFVEASRVLAERMLKEGGSTAEERIAYAFRRAVSRRPSEAEVRVLSAGLEKRLARYRADPEAARKLLAVGDSKADAKLDTAELAAYTLTASVILNLDETITRE
jgi:hypothetical protein